MLRTTANRGFTLIEMMVVVALIAIFALIGVPAYRSITTSNRMATEMNAFVGDLQFARSEAIKRGQDVTMCASANGTACLGANTTNWTPGWIVFADANDNDVVDAGDSILRIHAALQGGDGLASNAGGAITFNRQGFTTQGQTLTLNASTGNVALRRCAVLNLVGRARIDTGANCP